MNNRTIYEVKKAIPTREGAGVQLKRSFAQAHPKLDPFLLLDDFHSSDPNDYLPGFPWHPHRGIETVTYMLAGKVAHKDSLGNAGVISNGDVQWMTAGSGIIHEEMPQMSQPELHGLQLWVNLPAQNKMDPPRYQDYAHTQIPIYQKDGEFELKVICGRFGHIQGPVGDITTGPNYWDVSLPAGRRFSHPIDPQHNVLAYVLSGQGSFDNQKERPISAQQLVIYAEGDAIEIQADQNPLRFLLISGKPIREPVAWRGPIVMNTDQELNQAFDEYRRGTFIKGD